MRKLLRDPSRIESNAVGADGGRQGEASCCTQSARIGDRGLQCPLLAQSGHTELHRTCPLLGVKRTSLPHRKMSSAKIRLCPLLSESGHWSALFAAILALQV